MELSELQKRAGIVSEDISEEDTQLSTAIQHFKAGYKILGDLAQKLPHNHPVRNAIGHVLNDQIKSGKIATHLQDILSKSRM